MDDEKLNELAERIEETENRLSDIEEALVGMAKFKKAILRDVAVLGQMFVDHPRYTTGVKALERIRERCQTPNEQQSTP